MQSLDTNSLQMEDNIYIDMVKISKQIRDISKDVTKSNFLEKIFTVGTNLDI